MKTQRRKRTQNYRKQLKRRKKTLRLLLWVLLALLLITGIIFLIKSLTNDRKEQPKQEDNVTEITLPQSSFSIQKKLPDVTAKSKRVYTTRQCSLMSYPSAESEGIGVVKQYTVVIAYYEDESDDWYFVSWDDSDGNSGWVESKYLKDCYEDSCIQNSIDIPLEFYYQDVVKDTIELCGLDIDEYFIYGMMYVESRFNPSLVSSAGACGIMQIMPTTWNILYERYCEEYPDQAPYLVDDIFNENSNIILGIYCLKYLKEAYDINQLKEYQTKVLTSYNRGITGANTYFLGNDTYISEYSEKVLEAAEYIRKYHTVPD